MAVSAAVLALSFVGFPAPAAHAAQPIEPWQVATTKNISSAVVSPDGQWVAYTVSVPRKPMKDDNGRSWSELWLMPADGGTARPFITGEENVSRVRFTPDGEAISFTAQRGDDDNTALWVIPIAGGEARKAFEHEGSISSYDWNSDGSKVAFLSRAERSKEEKKAREQGFNQNIYEEDGLFTQAFVAVVSAPGSDDESEPDQVEVEGSVRTISFGADGESVLVTTTPTPLVDDTYTSLAILTVNLESGDIVRTPHTGKLGTVRVSPDGRHLAMIGAEDTNDPAAGRLQVTEPGKKARDLLPGLEGHVQSFAWKDSEHLVYVAALGAETSIGLVDLDGHNTPLIEPGVGIWGGLREFSGDVTTMIGQSPAHPSEAFQLAVKNVAGKPTATVTRLTDTNPWLDDVSFARQEVVRYEARDGLDLEAIVVHPLENGPHSSAGPHPLLLVIHGGPESHYSNGWLTGYSSFGQLAAARGFLVAYPNYRGSTGRGVEFSKISQADAAGPEFDDYVDLIDHLVEAGLADNDRVGITGGSYGGYASAWATTYYSDRFAAAAPFVGISNNISKVGTTDIPREMYDVHHRKWLWEDWDYFAERSPIYWVKRNKTPTLILHGAEDPRVHPSQSLELFRHLKVLDQAPVRLVLYQGEGHGNARSASRFDYMLRVLRWMEHFVRDGETEKPPYAIDYTEWLPWVEEEDEDGESSDNAAGGGEPTGSRAG